ncbi:MAG: hypothetical protein JWR75_2165 [Devosia sp.]|nr:hypothetical protein [Devosia sp.]
MPVTIKRLPNPLLALGIASQFISRRAPFDSFPAGDLIRTLHAQIQRGHYLFAFDEGEREAKVTAYLGWALYGAKEAQAYAATGAEPQHELTSGGDVVWIVTAAATTTSAFQSLIRVGHKLYPEHRVMAIRHRNGKREIIDRPAGRGVVRD